MRTTFSALLIAALLLVPAASAAAQGPTIITDRFSVVFLGDFHTQLGPEQAADDRQGDPRVRQAVEQVPDPRSLVRREWRKLGLRVVFVNLGYARRAAVRQAGRRRAVVHDPGGAAVAHVAAPAIGMPESRIKELHPEARFVDNNRFYPDGWWLRTARDRFGGGGKYPIVEARVRDGVVVAFDGWIGAGGE